MQLQDTKFTPTVLSPHSFNSICHMFLYPDVRNIYCFAFKFNVALCIDNPVYLRGNLYQFQIHYLGSNAIHRLSNLYRVYPPDRCFH